MRIIYLAYLILLTACVVNKPDSKIRPTTLTCEYLNNNPLVDVKHPRLAWGNIADKGERSQYQTAYQVRVASKKNKLSNPDLWDSGKVISDQSNYLPADVIERLNENGELLKNSEEIQMFSFSSDMYILKVGSGIYHFEF